MNHAVGNEAVSAVTSLRRASGILIQLRIYRSTSCHVKGQEGATLDRSLPGAVPVVHKCGLGDAEAEEDLE